ncbi:hypothetical protein JTB14_011273 [Gonioctena quinquepunctata]|nr:hypothetical protein JTB14_011273 [Gonioctena quinquepunctata]
MQTHSIPHHVYTLQEDKPLRVVFRHVPTEFSDSDIEEDLRDQGFEVRGGRNQSIHSGMVPTSVPSPDLFKEIPDDGEMPNWMLPPPEIVVSSEGIKYRVGEDDDIIIID